MKKISTYLVGKLGLGSFGGLVLIKCCDDGFFLFLFFWSSILSSAIMSPIGLSFWWKWLGHLIGWWDGLLGLEGRVGLTGGVGGVGVVDVANVDNAVMGANDTDDDSVTSIATKKW